MLEVLSENTIRGIKKGDHYRIELQNHRFGLNVKTKVEEFKKYTSKKFGGTVDVVLQELQPPHYIHEYTIDAVLNGGTHNATTSVRISLIED